MRDTGGRGTQEGVKLVRDARGNSIGWETCAKYKKLGDLCKIQVGGTLERLGDLCDMQMGVTREFGRLVRDAGGHSSE